MRIIFIYTIVIFCILACEKNGPVNNPPLEEEMEMMEEMEEPVAVFFCDSTINVECFELSEERILFAENVVIQSLINPIQGQLLFFDQDRNSLMKMDESFNLIEEVNYPHLKDHLIRSIITNSDNHLIILSTRWSTENTFITKLATDGELIWYQECENNTDELYDSIAELDSGGYLLVGQNTNFGFQSQIMITDEEGNAISSDIYESPESDLLKDIIKFKNGYILGGYSANNVEFFHSELFYYFYNEELGISERKSFGLCDGFPFEIINTADDGFMISTSFDDLGEIERSQVLLLKFDANENLEWRKKIGGGKRELSFQTIESSTGGYYISGLTSSNGQGFSDIYLAKLDQEGEVLWQKTYGTKRTDIGYALLELENSQLVLGGISLNPNDTREIVFLKLDSEGVPIN